MNEVIAAINRDNMCCKDEFAVWIGGKQMLGERAGEMITITPLTGEGTGFICNVDIHIDPDDFRESWTITDVKEKNFIKFSVPVIARERAVFAYDCMVSASDQKEAAKLVKKAIKEDGTAFYRYDVIGETVLDTFDTESEELAEDMPVTLYEKEIVKTKPRVAVFIGDDKSLIYGDTSLDVCIISDTEKSYDQELESVEMDTTMRFISRIIKNKKEIK